MGRRAVTRAFYQWCGGTPQDHEALAWFAGARPDQMGPTLARFRLGIQGVFWAKMFVWAGLVSAVLVLLVFLLSPPDDRLAMAVVSVVTVFGIAIFVMASCSIVARFYRHEVHQHGLVLRAPFIGAEAVPWATIDPGRIFVGDSIRSVKRMPVALYRQRAVAPPGVMINGWTKRPRGANEASEEFSAGYTYQPRPIESPFGWWQLGVTDPGAFLWAIESAMVADGYPAAGLTPFALSRRYTARDMRRDPGIQRERALEDPVIGLPAANPSAGPDRP